MRATLRHVLTSPPPPPSGAGGGISVPSSSSLGDDAGADGRAAAAGGAGNVLTSPTASTLGPAPQGTSLYTSSSSSSTPTSPYAAAAGGAAGGIPGGGSGLSGLAAGSAAALGASSAAAAASGGGAGGLLAAAAAPGSGSSRPRLLCVHPTLPLCAYVLTNPSAAGGKVDGTGGGGGGQSIAGLMRGAPPSAVASTLVKPRLHPYSYDQGDDATTDKEEEVEAAEETSTAIWDGRDERIVIQDYARDSIIKVFNVVDVAAWINAEECRRDLVMELEEEAALAVANETDGDDAAKKKKRDEKAAAASTGVGKTVMLGTIRSISFWDRHVGQYACADGLCDPSLVSPAAASADGRRDGPSGRRDRFRLPRGTANASSDGGGNDAENGGGAGSPGSIAAVSNQYRSGIRTNSALNSCGMMPQSLAVQFDTRTVLLNLKGPGRNPPPGFARAAGGGGDAASVLAAATATIPSGGWGAASSSASASASASTSPLLTIPVVDPYGPLTALITPEDLTGNVPTSPAVPITASVLAIGCSDGTVRFYDMDRRDSGKSGGSNNKKNSLTPGGGAGTVVKSVRGPNGRTDPVIRVVNVNSDSLSNANSGSAGDDKAARILTVCASGVAYLWEIFVSVSPATDGSGGSSVRLKINPPVCRLDGLGENRRAEINPTADFFGGRAQCSLVTSTRISYDAQNDVVSWCVPNYAGISRYHTATWDLRRVPQAATGVVAPRLPPRTVVVLPTSLSVPGEDDESKKTDGAAGGSAAVDAEAPRTGDGPDAVGTGPMATHSSGSSSSIIDIVPSYSHPSLPCEGSAVVCLLVTSKGDVATVASSLAGKKESATNMAIPFHRTSLTALFSTPLASSSPAVISPKNSAGVTAAALADVRGGVRVYAVAVPELLPTVCLLATSGGVTVVDLFGSSAQGIGSRHVLLAPGTIAPAADLAAAQKNSGRQQRNPGVLSVTQGIVYAATLNCPPINSRNVAFMGPIRMVNTTPVYNLASSIRSQLTTTQGIDGPSRLPPNALKSRPRLLHSPSGNYICLYWHAENRYEILHIGTLIKTARSSSDARQMSTERQTSALVDAGTNVLSFAWVGDEDVFSLLHPPSGGDDALLSDGLASPQGTSRKGGKRGMSKLKSKLASGAGGDDEEDEEFDPTAAGTIPRVELKVLVGVAAGATEISGSVAAATATTLGDLALRGGARHPPTALFGGPVLCVASLSHDREGRPDGMAYLYARKEGVEASDMRAASYSTVGPSLPYPDLAVWDDAGRTCAMVTGDRIAVYQVEGSTFSLAGTAPVLSGVRSDQGSIVVESLKFIQGVLYVTTQNTLQVVFFCSFIGGDEEEEVESRGTLDAYILAGPDVPTTSVSSSQQSMSKSFRPTPIPMALNQPSILSYHGSYLLLSTASGIRAVPLSHPLLRIGILIAAGQAEAASRWFDTVPRRHHEKLAAFLERRGAPDLAVALPGLSLETTVDICIRNGFTGRIKEIVDNCSVVDLRSIDGGGRGQGASSSILVGIALNLFANGHVDTVTRIASDLIGLGEEARSEGLLLAGLLVSAGTKNADVLLDRSIGTTREGGADIPAAVLRA